VFVAANLNVYHREGCPAAVVEPDVMAITGVSAAELCWIESYRTFQHGGSPVFVLEVLEHESVLAEMAHLRQAEHLREDLDYERAAYTAIGVAEYWRVDPHGGEYYQPALRGDRRAGTAGEPIQVTADGEGRLRGRSDALGLDLLADGWRLPYRDPRTGLWVPDHHDTRGHPRERDQTRRERDAARARAAAEGTARRAAETEVAALRAPLSERDGDTPR